MQSYVPNLEPRGSESKPKHWAIRTGQFILGLGVFRWLLVLLDYFGRGESAIDAYRYLPHVIVFLGHPAFGGVAIVVGFYLLIKYGKNPGLESQSLILNPETKLPFVRPGYAVKYIGRRTALTFLIALVLALVLWPILIGPWSRFVFVSKIDTALLTPSPPMIPTLVPSVGGQSALPSSARPVDLPREIRPTPVPPNTPQPNPAFSNPQAQPQYQPPPAPDANQPVACLPPEVLALGWKMSLEVMSSVSLGLPIENGPIRLTVDLNQESLHPVLKGKFGAGVPPFKGTRYAEAKAFFDDVGANAGTPTPRSYRPNEKLTRYVHQLSRSFHSLQSLNVEYMDGAVGESEAVASGEIAVPVSTLNRSSQAFIAKQDAAAKLSADEACKTYLKYLTGEQ